MNNSSHNSDNNNNHDGSEDSLLDDDHDSDEAMMADTDIGDDDDAMNEVDDDAIFMAGEDVVVNEEEDDDDDGSAEMSEEDDGNDDDDYDEDGDDLNDDDDSHNGDPAISGEEAFAAIMAGRGLIPVAFATAMMANTGEFEDELEEARSPDEKWSDYIQNVQQPSTKVVKITDACVANYGLSRNGMVNSIDRLVAALVSSSPRLTHIILGKDFFHLLKDDEVDEDNVNNNHMNSDEEFFEEEEDVGDNAFDGRTLSLQERIMTAVIQQHATTLTYIKLGSDGSTENPSLSARALLAAFASAPRANEGWSLTELELRGLKLVFSNGHRMVEQLCVCLSSLTRLKQLNLFGLQCNIGLDNVLETLTYIPPLDELQIHRSTASTSPLISPEALQSVLHRKPKWWRLALEGLGLTDAHMRVLARAFAMETCKAGDLLGLQNNPAISAHGYDVLFQTLYNKQRMGLVKVDSATHQATFDLVRSMNNLHRRMDYRNGGNTPLGWTKEQWITWLEAISKITWEDDCHKLNYIWFTVLERPDLVRNAS